MADLHALARSGNLSDLAVAIAKATAGKTSTKHSPLDARDQYNRTPLMLAAYEGHVQVIEMLVTEGASVQAVGKDQMTPLHFAASKGHTEVVRYLLNAGIKPNCKTTRMHDTPLHLAAKHGHTATVELLLRRRADATIANRQGSTAVDVATDPAIQELLKTAAADAVAKKEALAAKQAAKKQQQQEGDEEQQSGKRRIRKTGAADEQDGEEDAQPRVHQGAQEEGQVAKKPKVVIAYDDE